jgi:hypothetical protein
MRRFAVLLLAGAALSLAFGQPDLGSSRGQRGAPSLIHFATLPSGEPTGPWFGNDNKLLYLSIRDQHTAGPSDSRVIAIRHPGN